MRRTIGPAYELCPAERTGRYLSENFMRLVSGLVVALLFCLFVNFIVNNLLNFLASSGIEEAEQKFTHKTITVDLVKVIGGTSLVYFVLMTGKAK